MNRQAVVNKWTDLAFIRFSTVLLDFIESPRNLQYGLCPDISDVNIKTSFPFNGNPMFKIPFMLNVFCHEMKVNITSKSDDIIVFSVVC